MMAGGATYQRIVLKLSGESFCPADAAGIEPGALDAAVGEVLGVVELGVQVGIVVGGGNFVRARDLAGQATIQRVTADYMGMLGTVINGLALQDILEELGLSTSLFTSIEMSAFAKNYTRRDALKTWRRERWSSSGAALAGPTSPPTPRPRFLVWR